MTSPGTFDQRLVPIDDAAQALELRTRLAPLGTVERSRVLNALANAEIFTPAQLCATSAEALARIKNLGATSRAKLAVLGLLGAAAQQAAEASGPYRRSREVKRIREIVMPDLTPDHPAGVDQAIPLPRSVVHQPTLDADGIGPDIGLEVLRARLESDRP